MGVALAAEGRAPRAVFESWGALLDGRMELVGDPRVIAAAAALHQAASCTKNCPEGGRRQALVELRRACADLTPWSAGAPQPEP